MPVYHHVAINSLALLLHLISVIHPSHIFHQDGKLLSLRNRLLKHMLIQKLPVVKRRYRLLIHKNTGPVIGFHKPDHPNIPCIRQIVLIENIAVSLPQLLHRLRR